MPIKSQAQRRKFAELLMKGEISEEVYERWNREAGYKKLPERVKPKGKAAKGKRKSTSRGKAVRRRATTTRRRSTAGKTTKTAASRRKTKKR